MDEIMIGTQVPAAQAEHLDGSDLDNDARVRKLYSSLPLAPSRRCIRILHIRESPAEDPNAALEADLRVIDLDDHPNFTALSYVWGHDGTQAIRCGNVWIQITSNGYAALLALRKQLGSFEIWVDAVCINQNDTEEKQYQIPLMGAIYAKAATAYIWLGDETPSSAKVVKFFKRTGFLEHNPSLSIPAEQVSRRHITAALWEMYSPFRRGDEDPLPLIAEYVSTYSSKRFRRLLRPRANRITLNELRLFLDRAWIRRLWTFQEIVLATNPVIVCGPEHISWDRLCYAIAFVSIITPYSRTKLTSLLGVLSIWNRLIHIKTIHDSKRSSLSGNHKLKDLNAVRLSNYRDFIYRLLAWHNCFRSIVTRLLTGIWMVSFTSGIATIASIPPSSGGSVPKSFIAVPIILLSVTALTVLFQFSAVHSIPPFLEPKSGEVWGHPKHGVQSGEWVDAILTRSSTNPFDKAFGMHAVLQQLLGRQLPPPDYAKPLPDVYRDLCLQITECSNTLYHLLPASLSQQTDRPSWVPNWSEPMPEPWNAAAYRRKSHPAVWTIAADNPNHLTALAFRQGPIKTLFTFKPVSSSSPEASAQAMTEYFQTMHEFARVFPNDDTLTEFIFHMLRPNAGLRENRRWSSLKWAKETYKIRHKSANYAHERSSRFRSRGNTLFLQSTRLICSHLAKHGIALFHADIEGPYAYVGFCSTRAEIGDVVVDFVGGPCDFVVRGPWTAAKLISPATLVTFNSKFRRIDRDDIGILNVSSHTNAQSEPITLC